MSTTLDHLQAATLSLTRPGSIKDRLADAYRNHLAFVDEDDLSTELCEEFRGLTNMLTREQPLRGEDALRATVRKMSNHEAAEAASAVVRMFAAASRASLGNVSGTTAKSGTTQNGVTMVPFYVAEA